MTFKQFSDGIKELRLFSIGAFVFAAYLLYLTVIWITTKSMPNDIGDGIVVSGLVASLVGLCKFIFEFAIKKSKSNEE